jgi:hypothetical protein
VSRTQASLAERLILLKKWLMLDGPRRELPRGNTKKEEPAE